MNPFFPTAGSSGCSPWFPLHVSSSSCLPLSPWGSCTPGPELSSVLSFMGICMCNDLLFSRCHEQVHTVDRQRSWMSWSDAGVLPWGLEGLLGGTQGSRSRSLGTGRLSPQPCALPRSDFPRQAAHETSLISNCCAPPFIIIDSASP